MEEWNVKRTPNEDKALAWWCKANNLTPLLSVHPKYFFRNQKGEEVSDSMFRIKKLWEKARKAGETDD